MSTELTATDFHYFIRSFNAVSKHINAWAERKGWNEDDPTRWPEFTDGKARSSDELKRLNAAVVAHDISKIGLMGTELAEVIEGIRHGNPPSDKIGEFSAAEEELADTIIRIAHFAAQRGYRVGEALIAKLAYNEKRPYKHGKLA